MRSAKNSYFALQCQNCAPYRFPTTPSVSTACCLELGVGRPHWTNLNYHELLSSIRKDLAMRRKLNLTLILSLFTVSALSLTFSIGAQESSHNIERLWGPQYKATQRLRMPERHPFHHGGNSLLRLKHWNEVAIDASGLDHTPVAPGENRVFGEQLGPGRSSRAMAIVHIAIFRCGERDYRRFS